MPALPPGLIPLAHLASQLDDVSKQIQRGVLAYQDPTAVAHVRHELWLAAERLIHVLEGTWTGDDDVSAAA